MLWMPKLSTFSAMRMLTNVNPFVFMLQANLEWGFMRGRQDQGFQVSGVSRFVWYVASRLLCLVIGVDAFLVKFRATARYMNSHDVDIESMARVLVFLFQLMGITNLGRFSKKRLEIFIFGGVDGKVSNEEKGLQYFWNAMLAKRLFKKFSALKSAAILLSFDDFDFQRLLLTSTSEVNKLANSDVGDAKV